MKMTKYVLKRIALMFFVLFVITAICFVLIRILPRELPTDKNQAQAIAARWEALGYNEPLIVQFGIYLKNIFTEWDWGTSWKIDYMANVSEVIAKRLPPTVIINVLSMVGAIPIGIVLGIVAALKKNKWQDHLISTIVMIFVSVPSYVYAFIVQYFLGYKLGWFPVTMSSLYDAGAWPRAARRC